MTILHEIDIRRAIAGNACAAGRAYWSNGRVREALVAPDGRSVEGRVQGSARRPYNQHIRLSGKPDGPIAVSGDCSCPVGFNCKHVAAVLYEALARQPRQTAEVVAFRPPAPAPAPAPREPELSPQMTAWLADLARAEADDGEDYPPAIRQRLIYVLRQEPAPVGPSRLVVEPMSVTLRKDDSFSDRASRYSVSNMRQAAPPKFLRNADHAIQTGLVELGFNATVGDGERSVDTLRRIIATGRARWGTLTGPVVTLGEPRSGGIEWRLQADGMQRPYLEAGGLAQDALAQEGGLLPLLLADPWYAEPATGVMGPLTLDLSRRLLRTLLRSPPVPPEVAPLLRAEVATRVPRLAGLAPQELGAPRELSGPPAPVLRLMLGSVPFDHRLVQRGGLPSYAWSFPRVPMPMGRLTFRYGPIDVAPFKEDRAMHVHAGELLRVARDQKAERGAIEQLRSIDLVRLGDMMNVQARDMHRDDFLLPDPDETAWLDFMLEDAPQLRRDGWVVEVADDFPIRLAMPDGDIEARLNEGSGIDWFELDLGVMVDGQRIDLVPPLIGLIEAEGAALFESDGDDAAQAWVKLDDGRLLPLPMARIRPIARALMDLFNATGGKERRIGLSRLQAAEFEELAAAAETAGIVWQGGEALRALGRQLRETGKIPVATVPDSFRATLRPYQARGVDWLQFLRAAGLGGLLADDMGLGKTVQALAHIAIEQAEGRLDRPALVICPTSLVPNWRTEAARFAPTLKVLALHGPARKENFSEIAKHDLVITTYPLLPRDHKTLMAQEWHIAILDEAQNIKNPAADTSKLVRGLNARQRLCLTGTPMENHLGELWSLFDFVAPGFLGDRRGFQSHFRNPIEKGGDVERQALLARRVRPFLLRRNKNEVAADLPAKTEIPETVELAAEQRAVYESIRLAMHDRVRAAIAERGLARSGIVILDALLKMRQACCDPRLLKLPSVKRARAGSAKFERLMELVPELLDEGRSILLFSQFTEMLALIEQALAAAAIPYVLLTGDTRDRATPIRRFQSGEVKLFLISLKAGGVGLNLTAADTVIHYDPWWNPAVEDQATDRAHRIGQDKAVFVHKLSTLGTIEEKMEILKSRKRDLAAGILDTERGTPLTLTEADVEDLFAAA